MDDDDDEEDAMPRPYKLTLVAAGLSPADLSIRVERGHVLKVTGETQRTGARVARTFRLPRDADEAAAHAAHVDGILTLTVPKKISPEAKRIAINTTEPRAITKEAAAKEAAEEEDGVMVSGTWIERACLGHSDVG